MLPLDGIRVLDVTAFHLGPSATVLLADLGADVIKVERPEGDPVRLRGQRTDKKGIPAHFLAINRNKSSIVLDLQKEKGREIALQLAEKSDVFVHNMRPGAIERLGLGYEEVSKRNPKIIYASATPWGIKGPDAMQPANDLTGQARGGVMTQTGSEENPIPCGPAIADHLTGLYLAFAIVTALLAREHTGVAQHVDVSMLGSLIALQSREVTNYLINGPPILTWQTVFGALWNPVKTKDQWLCIGAVRDWPAFCKLMGLEYLVNDPRFATPEGRYENGEELRAILGETLAKQARQEWLEAFNKEEIIYSPVNTLADVVEDPQAIDNEYIMEHDYPGHGQVKVAGVPVHFSKMPIKQCRPSPQVGEHTQEILQELGYTLDKIAELNSQGVIHMS